MLPAILSSPSSSSTSIFPLHYSSASSLTNLSSLPLTVRFTRSTHNNYSTRVQASSSPSRMIEKETPETERPHTFLRESDEGASGDELSKPNSVRARFEKMIREVQDSVCAALEEVDGSGKFKEDVWSRPGGGGGISRVLQDGNVFEKAGVNVSVVYGVMPPEAYRAARPVDNGNTKPGPIPFFAAGVSSVIHPKNPFAPTVHFNYRYFETDAPKEISSVDECKALVHLLQFSLTVGVISIGLDIKINAAPRCSIFALLCFLFPVGPQELGVHLLGLLSKME